MAGAAQPPARHGDDGEAGGNQAFGTEAQDEIELGVGALPQPAQDGHEDDGLGEQEAEAADDEISGNEKGRGWR